MEPKNISMTSGTTTAPPFLSEADLIGTMDKNGIGKPRFKKCMKLISLLGTDATIHEHIKKVVDREYAIKRRDQSFEPTPLGLSLVEGFDALGFENSLTKPHLRAKTESDIKEIEQGKKSLAAFLDSSINLYRSILLETQSNMNVLIESVARNLKQEPNDYVAIDAPQSINIANEPEEEAEEEPYPVGPCFACGAVSGLKADEEEETIYIGWQFYYYYIRGFLSFFDRMFEIPSL